MDAVCEYGMRCLTTEPWKSPAEVYGKRKGNDFDSYTGCRCLPDEKKGVGVKAGRESRERGG